MSPQAEEVVASKYRLERHLARGGMGAIWRARHLELDVDVAIKFLRTDTHIDERADARFRREARAAAQLKSRNVVHIYDFGTHQGVSYLAMELLDGVDLEQFLGEGGKLSIAEALTVLQGASQGLKAVHRAGLIHRDIKPSNLFVANEGGEQVIKLLDFGIAKQLHTGKDRASCAETTMAGEVFGSPAYMSPEQARGGTVGTVSDLWSLAAVFYRMLTGQSPFQGENSGDVVVKACTEDPPPASSFSDDLGEEVDEFFRRALSRDPAQRFSEVDLLLDAAQHLTCEKNEQARLSVPLGVPAAVGRSTETAPLALERESQAFIDRVADQESSSSRVEPVGQGGVRAKSAKHSTRPLFVRWLGLLGVLLLGSAVSVWTLWGRTPEREGSTAAELSVSPDDGDSVNERSNQESVHAAPSMIQEETREASQQGSNAAASKTEIDASLTSLTSSKRISPPDDERLPTKNVAAPSPEKPTVSGKTKASTPGEEKQESPSLPEPPSTPTDPIFGLPVLPP